MGKGNNVSLFAGELEPIVRHRGARTIGPNFLIPLEVIMQRENQEYKDVSDGVDDCMCRKPTRREFFKRTATLGVGALAGPRRLYPSGIR